VGVEQPITFDLALNLKTSVALGLTFSWLLLRAERPALLRPHA
jgi:hypothetical protein